MVAVCGLKTLRMLGSAGSETKIRTLGVYPSWHDSLRGNKPEQCNNNLGDKEAFWFLIVDLQIQI